MRAHIKGGELFVQDLYAGADPAYRLNVRVITELAWHGALHPPSAAPAGALPSSPRFLPDFTILNCPSFKADPARHGCRSETVIAISFEQRLILIGGTAYAGENKKAVFTLLNYLLPERGRDADALLGQPRRTTRTTSAVFFGLSGTGKTTLSADPGARPDRRRRARLVRRTAPSTSRAAATPRPSTSRPEAEPEIYATTSRFGTVVENVVYDPATRVLDFADDSLTANTRCAYPLESISNASPTGRGGEPQNVVMLTCRRLRRAAADRPADAGAGDVPLPLRLHRQGRRHRARRDRAAGRPSRPASAPRSCRAIPRSTARCCATASPRAGVACWLVNTGWTGGAHGTGRRMPIAATRALLAAALDGSLDAAAFRRDPIFGFEVPTAVAGRRPRAPRPAQHLGRPGRPTTRRRSELVAMFAENFAQYEPHVADDVRAAALSA